MARTLTARDAHAIINLVAKEALGENATIQAVDASSFVSVGEAVLASGVENTLNALSIVLGKTFMATRPYKAKFNLITENNSDLYNTRMRKISFYSKEALESGDWNTQLKTNLAEGYDNGSNGGASTASMWEQNRAMPLEFNFGGLSVWEDSITIYEYQLKPAFRSEANFNAFISGIMTEKGNDIESQKEAFSRIALLNHIAGVYDMSANMKGSVVNLTNGFNAKFGTSYTGAQLRTTYLKEFLEYMTSEIKQYSRKLTYRTANYHWPVSKVVDGKTYTIKRHTPVDKQKLFLYNPLITDAETMVLPEIFNDNYLKPSNYEPIDFWQNFNEPSKISVTPAIPNVNAPASQTVGDAVELDYVVGCLFDADALMINHNLEDASTTPQEARKHYRNLWWTFGKNIVNDFTENFILFVM